MADPNNGSDDRGDEQTKAKIFKVITGTMLVSRPMTKPPTIAASSAAALMRHQNQRKISTRPGPVPIAITSRKTVATSVEIKAAIAPTPSPLPMPLALQKPVLLALHPG